MGIEGHVNASGFPLQIGIVNLINSTSGSHGWKVFHEEHSWHHEVTNQSGFIDLSLINKHGTVFLNVECKRVKDSDWIFLIDDERQLTRRHAKAFFFDKGSDKIKFFDWTDLVVDPECPESKYCVIPGGDKRSKSMIERVAADLICSTEAIVEEEQFTNANNAHVRRFYFNVIVTTATLQACTFDASKITLEDGHIHKSQAKEVPFVRFRKQLLPFQSVKSAFARHGMMSAASAKENTVFIVNANHLLDFLLEFEVSPTNFSLRGF